MATINEVRENAMQAGFSGETLSQIMEILDAADSPDDKVSVGDLQKIAALAQAELEMIDESIDANESAADAWQGFVDGVSEGSDQMIAGQISAETRFTEAQPKN